MEKKIRHRRLYAFYKSTVLNVLMIGVISNLFMMLYYDSSQLPAICCAVSLACFIGYTLWLWTNKPAEIVINSWLSNFSCWYTIYFLIIIAMKWPDEWWYGAPIIGALIAFCIYFIRGNYGDEEFRITDD